MQAEEGTDWLLELLTELQLQQYFLRIRDELNVTRLSHFEYVKNEDLEKIGMGRPGAYISPPRPPPVLLAGCTASFGEPRGSCGPWGWRGAPLQAGSVVVIASLCPAGQRRLWEAVKRRKAMCKRKSWMSKVEDGRGAGVTGQLRQAGGAGPLPMLFPGAWLTPCHQSLGAGREMGISPCHACPACSVTLTACALVPCRLLGHFPVKDGPATPGNSFPSCYLPLCHETRFQLMNETQSLCSPQPAVWAASLPVPLPTLLPHSEGTQPYACRVGDLGMLMCAPDAILSKASAAATLAPPGTLHPPKKQDACQLGAGSWPLPCVTHLGWDGLLIEGYSASHRAQKCHLPPRPHAGPSPCVPHMGPGCRGWDGPYLLWGTSSVLTGGEGGRGREPVLVPSELAVAAAHIAKPTSLQGCVTALSPSWRFLLASCPGTLCGCSLAKESPGPSSYRPGLPGLL